VTTSLHPQLFCAVLSGQNIVLIPKNSQACQHSEPFPQYRAMIIITLTNEGFGVIHDYRFVVNETCHGSGVGLPQPGGAGDTGAPMTEALMSFDELSSHLKTGMFMYFSDDPTTGHGPVISTSKGEQGIRSLHLKDIIGPGDKLIDDKLKTKLWRSILKGHLAEEHDIINKAPSEPSPGI
jgi:hypothetical protein